MQARQAGASANSTCGNQRWSCTRCPRKASKLPRRYFQTYRCAYSSLCTACQTASSSATLLDRFWQAQGVTDSQHRQTLVAAATKSSSYANESVAETKASPRAAEMWKLDQVLDMSQKLLQLQQLLGDQDDVDVVWMLIREPGLLNADIGHLSSRLMTMKLAAGSAQVDVIKIVQDHPSLLLQQHFVLDEQETSSNRVKAWQHGLVSDGELEWEKRCLQLAQYNQQHGDAHIGYRDGENADLARWAKKQRYAHRCNTLEPARAEQLKQLEFELDDESAEWLRSFNDVKAYQGLMGHSCPGPLTTGASFLLTNWCSVQRVARRSGVLPATRIAMLDEIEFDWTCADALS